MQRLYQNIIQSHFDRDQQMIFLAGPRQVGKTTLSQIVTMGGVAHYFNWDVKEHRGDFMRGPLRVAERIGLTAPKAVKPIVIFDELHKYKQWRSFLKGFYDLYKHDAHTIVTGSAKFDIYRKGGDSLMGRYFSYRIHPLSVAELLSAELPTELIRPASPLDPAQFAALWQFGGFPEPYLKADRRFWQRWISLRHEQLFGKDIKDLSNIQEIDQLEVLATHLKQQASQLLNHSSLAKKIGVSVNTVKRWVTTLKRFYFCFTLKPWSKNIVRSLLKEPKLFLWDWSEIIDEGQRLENFVACHLHKTVDFWNDYGLGKFGLHFIRDKEQREVDFVITKDQMPWILIEVKKSNNQSISKHLYHFYEKTKAPHAFQVVLDLPFENIDCFSYQKPVIVPLSTFLSQLV